MVNPKPLAMRTCQNCEKSYDRESVKHDFGAVFCSKRCAQLDWLSETSIPLVFDDTDLGHPSLAQVAGQIAKVQQWTADNSKPGLLLYGVISGRGKSRVGTAAFLDRVCEGWRGSKQQEWWSSLWFNVMQFRREYARVMMDSAGKADWMLELSNARHLFIDDIDKLKPSDGLLELLFAVLDERLTDGKVTILTTNLSGDALAKRWGDEVGPYLVRRLRDYCLCLNFDVDAPAANAAPLEGAS